MGTIASRLGWAQFRQRASSTQEVAELEIAFESKRLRTICESEKQSRSAFGDEVAEILKHRLADFRAAGTVRDLVVG